MKIVIVGKNSYIGQHIGSWIAAKKQSVLVEYVDSYTEWEHYSFTGVDSVIVVAGIVHHPEIRDWATYDKVNIQLPVAVAQMAKSAGVSQFVFLSTMAVYGRGKRLKSNYISKNDIPNAEDMYGKSKYFAEQKLYELEDINFKIAIVRPPNVYGKGCRGGYIAGFASVLKKIPIIPVAFENVKQSVIFIDNLCELIWLIVLDKLEGVFEPQDDHAVSAVEIMEGIAIGLGLKRKKSKILGVVVKMLSWMSIVKKAYGGIAYKKECSVINGVNYIVTPFIEAIKNSVSE